MKGLYGLLGEKLVHSFSPQIHSLIFKELKINGYYHLFEVDEEDIEHGVSGFKAFKVQGVNVTIPYKVRVMDYIDDISLEAKNIGAINTICFKNGKTKGYNTDYYGFGMMLENFNIDVKGKNVVILGTGGASRAVKQYLLDNKVEKITFVTRDLDNKRKELENYNLISYSNIENLKNQDIVINCTPCGMYPNTESSPLTESQVAKFKVVVDLIYNPQETLIMKYARNQRIKAVNGLYMLVGQAIKSQELWNSLKIKKELVDKIYENIKNLL
ncbi:shikimate dehydrogenase [Clostridium botulinum]|uniref:Shikimate dehydrogenase (NADP(+)) n=1 Tax=Clostridium botulinum TaxID=1491 RepID=A0A9Q1ZE44_CLOBO|nr:shikimate dehydrogenase [Clostridium botulinum]AEB77022.1 shikimate 5-dehydrogenase [Clostridium botulinum BKT015925]KEH98451.1 shikimate dehydrogenase [Clostridium botulinum D str. 16868]KEI04517.1 shikimate dehydrogenase [Clostridium botulinum C/D str. Sp77]KLU76700.1 shikimate dehydrogenase [Clostridium botulinum V891]KOA76117.1 shikimate dehydrogenase [Clostridium botulinum]